MTFTSNEELSSDYFTIGVVGCSNLSVLLIIALWRFSIFLQNVDRKEVGDTQYFKKLGFYSCIILSIMCDFPMYVGFVQARNYILNLYAFHKLTVAFLFSAYSITISDWIHVLYDIREDATNLFHIRRGVLVGINIIIWIISLINFSTCFATVGMTQYMNSPLYIVAIFVQIIGTLTVNIIMLNAGLKLHNRIAGASGFGAYRSSSSSTAILKRPLMSAPDLKSGSDSRGSFNQEFHQALKILNRVMAICFLCISVQILLLLLNYTLGYAQSANKTVGPVYFYWFFYAWLPLWGPVGSLLYLARTSIKKKIQSPYVKPITNVSSEANLDDDDEGTDSTSRRSGTSSILYEDGHRRNSRNDSSHDNNGRPIHNSDDDHHYLDGDINTDVYAIDYRPSNFTQTSGISVLSGISHTGFSDMGYRDLMQGRHNGGGGGAQQGVVADYDMNS